jgi:hypothetical protein
MFRDREPDFLGGVEAAAPNLCPRLKVSDLRCMNLSRLPDRPAGANRVQCLVEEPDNLILRHLRDLRTDIAEVKAELKADMNSLRADVASDFVNVNKEIAALRKETREQIVGVRRALTEYHSAVVGHGILISDLEERVQRIEQHLDISPGAH